MECEYETESFFVEAQDGYALSLHRLGRSRRGGPALLWGSAAGVPALSYVPFLTRLTDQFDIYLLDTRGMEQGAGLSDDGIASLTIDLLASDVERAAEAVRERTGSRPLMLATHSMAGALALRAGCGLPRLPWKKLLAFDPPVYPDEDYGLNSSIDEMAKRRLERLDSKRTRWPSPQVYWAKLQRARGLAAWEGEALRCYARWSLKKVGANDYEIVCSPALEKKLHLLLLDPSTWQGLQLYRGPVSLIGADTEAEKESWACLAHHALAKRLPDCRSKVMAGARHMMVFENPEQCAALVRELLP